MPPSTRQNQDPRSPRPFPPGTVSTALTSIVNTPSSETAFNPTFNSRISLLTQSLRDERARINQIRDVDASFRRRLRSIHGPQPLTGSIDSPSSMPEPRQTTTTAGANGQRMMDLVHMSIQHDARNAAQQHQQARLESSAERSVVEPNHPMRNTNRSAVRRRPRPSYSLLRPSQREISNTEAATSEARRSMERLQRSPWTRHRSDHPLSSRHNHQSTPLSNRAYLEDTVTESDSDLQDPRPATKRRKTSHDDDLFEGYDPVRYGWNGQVDPGQLRLEIASCDGGQYDQTLKFRAENVLRNDKSVYCSNSSTCSFVFRHQGDSTFHLDALVVKGPQTGYTSPVQQGLVFVGMCMRVLHRSADAYQMSYSSSNPLEPPLDELMEDQNLYLNSQNRNLGRMWENISRIESYESAPGEGLDCDWPSLDGILVDGQVTTTSTSPDEDSPTNNFWNIAGELDVAESRRTTRTTVYTYGNHTVIASGTGNTIPSEPEYDEDDASRDSPWGADYECPTYANIITPGRIEKVVPATQRDCDILRPNATFFIRRSQNRITIKFDPPM